MGPGRWWWLKREHWKFRCWERVLGEGIPGRQCRQKAVRDGYCKLHQKKKPRVCSKCKRPFP